MNILLVTEYYPPRVFGGGELSAQMLAQALALRGHTVTVLTARAENQAEAADERGVRVIRRLRTGSATAGIWDTLKRLFVLPGSARRELSRLLRLERFDVVHCPNPSSGAILRPAASVAHRHGLPFLVTLNGFTLMCPKGNLFYKERAECSGCAPWKYIPCAMASEYFGRVRVSRLLRWNPLFLIPAYLHFMWRWRALRKADRIIAYTTNTTAVLRGYGLPIERIATIPSVPAPAPRNPVLAPELARELKNKTVVLCVSALERTKGIQLLLQAFAQASRRTNSLLVLAGSGAEEQEFKQLAQRLGIAGQVKFLGKVEYGTVAALQRRADIIVLPSLLPEAFSRVSAEAAAAGKPLIATEVGGNRDSVIDGRTGFLVQPAAGALAGKLAFLIQHPATRREFGRNAVRFFEERLERERVLGSIERLYANVAVKA
jgi:glycosyltransferase involved in cell wall biosynthesis